MHALLMLASLLANPAPAQPAALAPADTQSQAAPPRPRSPAADAGERARLDPYGGWRDDSRQDPALLALLGEQNRWTEQQLAAQRPLEQALQAEWQAQRAVTHAARVAERGGQPVADGSRRQPVAASGEQAEPRQRLAARQPASGYYELASWALHPNGRWLALAEDLQGDRDYRITLLDLADGKTWPP
jgi:oligopeptidase B